MFCPCIFGVLDDAGCYFVEGSAAFSANGSLGTYGTYGYMLHGC